MPGKIFGPRKQRTCQHVIADQSINHVERFTIEEGHSVQRLSSDYGYDLAFFTYDEQGYIEPSPLFLQLKAAESLQRVGSNFVFDLDIRDYNLWMMEPMPVILVLFDVYRRKAYWLAIQQYFDADAARRPPKGARTVRVPVPQRQVVNRLAVAKWRVLKWITRGTAEGEVT
jgi:Domain of unknown function (DUF4365)